MPQDLKDIQAVLNSVQMQYSSSPKKQRQIQEDFTLYLQQVRESLAQRMQQPFASLQVEVLKSKFFLLDVCFEKALADVGTRESIALLEDIRRLICEYFVQLCQLQQQSQTDLGCTTEHLNKIMRRQSDQQSTLQKNVNSLTKQLQQSETDLKIVQHKLQHLQKEYNFIRNEHTLLKNDHDVEVRALKQQIVP